MITGLVVSLLAIGVLTALVYRAALTGLVASAGAVLLLGLALLVAWASGRRRLDR